MNKVTVKNILKLKMKKAPKTKIKNIRDFIDFYRGRINFKKHRVILFIFNHSLRIVFDYNIKKGTDGIVEKLRIQRHIFKVCTMG